MKLLIFDGDTPHDMTKRVGNVVRSDNVESLAQELGFDYLYNRNDRYTMDVLPMPGDGVQLLDDADAVLLEGTIENYNEGFGGSIAFTAFDHGLLLNENEVDIQFNGAATSKAIEDACEKYGVAVDCVEIATPVTKNYFGEPLGQVLKNLIGMATHATGDKYRLEVQGRTVVVKKYEDMTMTAMYQPAANLAPFDATLEPSQVQVSGTLSGTYNAIKIIKDGNENEQVLIEEVDEDSIARSGRREKVAKAEDEADAKKMLADLKKPKHTMTVTLLNDDAVRSGRILKFNHKAFKGEYLVKNCSHHYSAAGATMTLELLDPEAFDASVEAVSPEAVKQDDGFLGISGDGIATGRFIDPTRGAGVRTQTAHWHGDAIDIGIPIGTPLVASDGGTVTYADWQGSYGKVVFISHDGGYQTIYAHQDRIVVSSGMKVSQGQLIGYSGNTGVGTGPHLHFEISRNGAWIYPGPLIGR